MSEIHEMSCPCCERVLRISDSNAQRLFMAAADRFGSKVTLDISKFPDVDWTADVSDEVITAALDSAYAAPVRRRSKMKRKRGRRP